MDTLSITAFEGEHRVSAKIGVPLRVEVPNAEDGGYLWNAEWDRETMTVREADRAPVETGPDAPVPGDTGPVAFTVISLAAGSGTLELTLKRPWEASGHSSVTVVMDVSA